MANPPKPYDVLTLSFECARLGGIKHCAFKFPAGAHVSANNREPLARAEWRYPEHIKIYDNEGHYLGGEQAIIAIAEARCSIQNMAQIVAVAPRHTRPCECRACRTLIESARIAKLIGEHPE